VTSRKVDICSQAPGDYPEFAAFLVGAGIDSISLNPRQCDRRGTGVANTEKKAGEGRLVHILLVDVGDSRFVIELRAGRVTRYALRICRSVLWIELDTYGSVPS
jgi:hypothetical protein